jgi:phosphoadenosine phosphosulfate reductase
LTKPATTKKKAEQLGVEYSETRQGGIILNNDNDESRELVEDCYKQHKTTINPIVDWTDRDVWEFLHHYGCESNPLYQCGWSRIGCVGCPMAGRDRYREFREYPKYKLNYIRAFDRMLKARETKGLGHSSKLGVDWSSGEKVFKWWLGEDVNQITFDDLNTDP